MVKEPEEVRAPSLTCTVMEWLVPDSKLSFEPSGTGRRRVAGLMGRRPPASLVRLWVGLPPSVAGAVRPTAVPLAAFSETVLAALSASVGADGATLVTLME